MIEIYPNPYQQNPQFFGYNVRNSPLSTYSYFSSVDFEVSAYDDSTSQYSAAFVYRCGDPYAWAPFYYNAYSVYGTGVTGAPDNSFSPWAWKSDVRFNYLNFGTNQETKVRVKYKKAAVTSVDIGPYKKNYNSKWSYVPGDASCIEISSINSYDKLIVNINNDLSTPLYLFANPIETLPPAQDPTNIASYLYVSAGIWEISALVTNYPPFYNNPTYYDAPEFNYRLNIPSNYIVYLAPGAYVDGTFSVRGKHDVTFSGPGIIDAGRPYVGNWWTTVGFEAVPAVYDADKLIRAPIYSFSSFSETSSYVEPSAIRVIGPTIVNNIIYAGSCEFKQVDNSKLISLWPNCDGFNINDNFHSPDPNKYSSLTRSFLQTGDDTTYVGRALGDLLVSSCYLVTLAGTTFRTYAGQYNYNDYRNTNDYWYSAIDVDCRSYAAPSYNQINYPIFNQYLNSIFGINISDKIRRWANWGETYKATSVTNHLFSGIRVENLLDIPLFDIGLKPYTDLDYSPRFGSVSAIIFKDITASSHPNSKYRWLTENKLNGETQTYRPHDVSFINVVIDGEKVTNLNKNNYFVWNNKPIPRDYDSTIITYTPSLAGSSIADVYVIIGDSIAAGYDSSYADRVNTSYASMGSELTGCYIWTPSSTSFEVIKPGVNILTNSYNESYTPGKASLESTLAWRARQDSGDRDVYIIKYAEGGTMPVSSTSSTNDPPISASLPPNFNRLDWSVSSSGEMFQGFSSTVTSALLNLSSNYKYVDLKSVIIFLGTNVPIQTAEYSYTDTTYTTTAINGYKNLTLASSLIDSEVSSLISGIGKVIGAPATNVDLSYTKYIWALPLYENEAFYISFLNNYLKTFNDKIRSLSSAESAASPAFSSIVLPMRVISYLPPSESYYHPPADGVHYNFSGYAKITDDIYQILQQETSSVTDPSLNPDVNYYFSFDEIINYWVKIENVWKPSNAWVKVNGQWKLSTGYVKVDGAWS